MLFAIKMELARYTEKVLQYPTQARDTGGIVQIKENRLIRFSQQDPHGSYSRIIGLSDSLFAVCSPKFRCEYFLPTSIFSRS